MERFAEEDEDNEKDCESLSTLLAASADPLLKEGHGSNTYGSIPTVHRKFKFADAEHSEKIAHGITDTMMYRTESLVTWEAFQITFTTVWVSKELWVMMLRLMGLAFAICLLTIVIIPRPDRLKVAKFTEVSKFLNVVVGLLMGFFLTSSMNRWHSCVNSFLQLLDAIRNLQMQLVALGVPDKDSILMLRYAFASAWLLYGTLLLETISGKEAQIAARAVMYEKLHKKVARIDPTGNTVLLTESEISAVRNTRDPPGVMWMWVAAFIGRLAQDGVIPPMQSPTYGRIMSLCEVAHGGIRNVHGSISVQAPLTYTHMLATLVHINNLLCALTLGVVSGVAIGTSLMAHDMHLHTSRDASWNESTRDWQTLLVTFLYCTIGPCLYQALLIIALHLAQPFDTEDAEIPFNRLLHSLEVDMCNGRDLVEYMPFQKPCFKQPPKPAAPAPPPAPPAARAAA